MDAKELRIGNWLNIVDPSFGKIETSISADVICDIEKMQANGKPIPYAPIPLTEEWLLKFGFYENNGVFTLSRKHELGHEFGDFHVSTYDSTQMKVWRGERYVGIIGSCGFVHKLQNLYFALTGQELEIKQ